MTKHLFLYSLAGLMLVGFAFQRTRSKPTTQVSGELAAPTVDAAGIVHVGSIRLWRDYAANEVAADNLYKGKSVRVKGRVLSISRDPHGAAVLHLVSSNPVFQTMATLEAAETQRAAALVKGTPVTVQCVGNGLVMRMPQLEHCSLDEPR
ncbi:MAG: OB-fold putative lipoprotein [Gemmatimonadota bacterium]|nr:OB-fold putative lipoprotein [Gemmatimonadota bacterium]